MANSEHGEGERRYEYPEHVAVTDAIRAFAPIDFDWTVEVTPTFPPNNTDEG